MENLYPTAHIAAAPGDFAPTVLMPGDPLRAQFVAENFFESPVLVNNVRGIQGYTGYWQGTRVSVMASGMGAPSIGIYSYELFHIFGVHNILRIGSAGGMQEEVHLRDIVLGQGSCTNSAYGRQYNLPGTFAPIADFTLLETAAAQTRAMHLPYHVGNLLCADNFYTDDPLETLRWKKMGVLAVEMESAALYMNAARTGKRALALCTISDHLLTHEALPALERQTSFTDMMELALRVAVQMQDR